jgi:DNA-binding GntR family transcriptional regulator
MPAKKPAKDTDRPLKEQAYSAIREMILSGEVPAGSYVSERQMAARLEMSKTPIRVALERLAQDGFVEILPQRGVRVRALSVAEIVDHYDLRIALETWVVEAATAKATDADVAFMRARIGRQRAVRLQVEAETEADERDGTVSYVEEDAELHRELATLAGNREVLRVLELQRQRLARIVAELVHRRPSILDRSIAEHERIVDAVAAGDAADARQAIVDHLERGKQALIASLTAGAEQS